MARVAKQVVYKPDTIMGLLNSWAASAIAGSNVPANKTLQYFAAPDSKEAFLPNAPAMYGLLNSLQGSLRQHMSGTRANYNSFMSMYSRWKKDYADWNKWEEEINANPKANVHTRFSDEYMDARDALSRPVTGWVSYEAWLQVLGKAGVLDRQVITSIPRHYQGIRENLMRMYKEWLALADRVEPEPERRVEAKDDTLLMLGNRAARGGLSMPKEVFDVVGTVPEVTGLVLTGLLEDNAIFNGYAVRGDIDGSVSGCIFMNCIFMDVVFRGNMDNAVFIGCDFEGDCRMAMKITSENLVFKKCNGSLDMANRTLTGLCMYSCGGMTVNIRRSCISKSHIVDGWVSCGRLEKDRTDWDAPCIAPRAMLKATWDNGGLVFDSRGVKASDLNDSVISSVSAAMFSAAQRMALVVHPENGAIQRLGEVAESLFEEYGLSTRDITLYRYEVPSQETIDSISRTEEVRTRSRGAAKEVDADATPPKEEVNPLEAIVLAEYEEAQRQQSEE